jgi:hypothetical protein
VRLNELSERRDRGQVLVKELFMLASDETLVAEGSEVRVEQTSSFCNQARKTRARKADSTVRAFQNLSNAKPSA